MDKIHKYCSELRKAYDLEEINSNKATVIRKKLRRMLLDMEVENDGEPPPAIELFWRDVDRDWLNLIVSIFCGELQSMLAANSRNAAVYNMYIGDLHRFFLLSLIARYPFHSAWGNLLRTLSQDFENPIESIMAQIVSKILYYYRSDISKNYLYCYIIYKQLIFYSKIICEIYKLISSLPKFLKDAFLFTIPLMCDCFSFLLDKIITTEDEENLVQKRSRRRRISSDDDSDDSDGKSETENFIDKQDLQDEVNILTSDGARIRNKSLFNTIFLFID
uniref:EST1-like DNA-binding domain-containing protein n=1 Tax=Heterorhabditis bacteriophora TaxID=37862 RepID=A0A1I7W7H4_HETBA